MSSEFPPVSPVALTSKGSSTLHRAEAVDKCANPSFPATDTYRVSEEMEMERMGE